MKHKFIPSLLLLFVIHFSLKAGEGMWLPHLLKALNESDMKAMGMKINAEDIYSVNKGSLKDAVGHFGGFCTSEIISSKGLVLTNHHCGYGAIQSHTTLEKNYLRDGFWAKDMKDELPNDGLYVRFIERIEDITDVVLKNVKEDMTVDARQFLIDNNIKSFKSKQSLDKFHELEIKAFYAGNQYLAFYMVRYDDVRLVGTPPESIGKFGADTDNWVWPRHTGDFSLFRIYAGPNNEPAAYNENNKPYEPKHFLPVSMSGIEEGDFTMVFGFPGRTDEYLPAIAVEQLVKYTDPARIKIRDNALKIMDKYMRQDEATRIKYAAKYANIANYWKKWIGEVQGLKKSDAVNKKLQFEKEFEKRAKAKGKYTNLLQQFNEYYTKNQEVGLVRDYFSEVPQRNIELLRIMGGLRNLALTYDKSGEVDYQTMKEKVLATLENFYKDYDADIDKEIFVSLMEITRKDLNAKYLPASLIGKDLKVLGDNMYKHSNFTSLAKTKAILDMSPKEAVKMIRMDPAYELAFEWNELNKTTVNPVFEKNRKQIDSLQQIYMKAQMELFPEKKFFPDANSTLRVTYGKVQGYKPRDGVHYQPVTYLDGIIEKYVPGDYEFDLSNKMLDLYNRKDYGQYTDKTGKVPVCFIGSNHTTGGNSGSPAIDAHGNLIGLNFDRVWEGTMSDINYDPEICRNIMVDSRYILFVIDKYAGAKRLVDEMKLVYPKGKKKK